MYGCGNGLKSINTLQLGDQIFLDSAFILRRRVPYLLREPQETLRCNLIIQSKDDSSG